MDDVGSHNIYGLLVLATLWDDEVGITFCGLYEFQVHGLQHIDIAVHNHLSSASALYNVTCDDAHKAVVGICIHEDL